MSAVIVTDLGRDWQFKSCNDLYEQGLRDVGIHVEDWNALLGDFDPAAGIIIERLFAALRFDMLP